MICTEAGPTLRLMASMSDFAQAPDVLGNKGRE
jgi:hypothetical protein